MTGAVQDWDEWLRLAQRDLGMARSLANDGYHDGACFHGQQAVEKALKALLYRLGYERTATHSLHTLASLCGTHFSQIARYSDKIRQLDAYYIAPRYPNGIPPEVQETVYTRADSENAIGIAQKTLEMVQELIEKE